jgi:antimicrobial peptide system SdpB family protein
MKLYIESWANHFYDRAPWTNVAGVARSVLAMGTLLTLLTNSTHTLFPESTQLEAQAGSPLASISLFFLLQQHIEWARWLAIAGLLLVVSGWRPRYTGLIHWYIAFSFFASCTIIDGGDHLASVLSLLLVPICLADARKWHWLPSPSLSGDFRWSVALSWVFVLLIRCQVGMVYLHAGVAKLGVKEWVEGTAAYYWTTHHYHGVASWLKPLVWQIMSSAWGVSLVTWGTMLLELVLFSALMMPSTDRRRKWLLMIGLGFHFSIVLMHGLISFFCSMAAALILFMQPADKSFVWDFAWVTKRRKATPQLPSVTEPAMTEQPVIDVATS